MDAAETGFLGPRSDLERNQLIFTENHGELLKEADVPLLVACVKPSAKSILDDEI